MDTLVLRAVVFYVEVCFVLSQSQGTHVFQPIIRNVSMTKHFSRLKLKWDVHGDSKAYAPETELIFNIQVNQTEENRTVLNTNYSVALSKINQSLEWSWDPLVPLQCEPHVIRIRSLVVDKNVPRSETWSNWSPWEGVRGLATVDDTKNYILPQYPYVKAGSNVTFCCIANKTNSPLGFTVFQLKNNINTTDRKIYFYVKNVSVNHHPHVYCEYSDKPKGTKFTVIELPKKPKDFTCKTEEKMLKCSWRTEKMVPKTDKCKTELVLTDVSSGKIYCENPLNGEEDSCSFTTGEEQIPKLRLTAKNCFGNNSIDYPSEVPHNEKPTEKETLVITLLLGIISLLLLMSICFCSIYCIRHRCFSTIPKPEVSPFLKRNPGTMEVCDIDPDRLEVMENHQTCTGKENSLGVVVIENITYFDPAYNPTLQEREGKSKSFNPPSTSYKPLQDFVAVSPPSASYKPLQDFFAVSPPSASYKPLQDFFAVSPPSASYKPLQDFFAVSPPSTSYKPQDDFFENKPIVQPSPQDQDNFSYTAGMKIPDSVAQLDDFARLGQGHAACSLQITPGHRTGNNFSLL